MSLGNLRPVTLLKPFYYNNLQDIDSIAKQGQGEGEQRGYLSGVEVSLQVHPSRRHPGGPRESG